MPLFALMAVCSPLTVEVVPFVGIVPLANDDNDDVWVPLPFPFAVAVEVLWPCSCPDADTMRTRPQRGIKTQTYPPRHPLRDPSSMYPHRCTLLADLASRLSRRMEERASLQFPGPRLDQYVIVVTITK